MADVACEVMSDVARVVMSDVALDAANKDLYEARVPEVVW